MNIQFRRDYDDLDLRIQMGHLQINVWYIRFVPASLRTNKKHAHGGYELHFIPYGFGQLIADGNHYEITPNTFYLTGPMIYHEQMTDPDNPLAECCINFDITVTKKRKQYNEFIRIETDEMIEALSSTRFWFGEDEYRSIELFQKIMDELDNRMVGYYHNIRSYISQIIVNAVRSYRGENKADYALPRKTLNEKREHLLDALMNSDTPDMSLDQMAVELMVSKRHLHRLMKKQFQMTFKQKLSQEKLETAKKLLIETNLTIDEVAHSADYSSSSYFCKKFKAHTGMSPTKYRQAAIRE
ncbi:AraC family transcriptional regulator [Paenibacillus sp. H1-7]|uniref:AraC family transcriptional regulator n=1 Tax=Paenibacillus sp. H1-7 TaxID=2282849 RepID=UPI001EF7BAC9|nr:AraC family transcriptional regulator [Paenibacillus sp. H1-7]ULL14734.1 AraC family transcriptional regulator [Paenibacillus sp. H1-7]